MDFQVGIYTGLLKTTWWKAGKLYSACILLGVSTQARFMLIIKKAYTWVICPRETKTGFSCLKGSRGRSIHVCGVLFDVAAGTIFFSQLLVVNTELRPQSWNALLDYDVYVYRKTWAISTMRSCGTQLVPTSRFFWYWNFVLILHPFTRASHNSNMSVLPKTKDMFLI